MRCLLVVSMTDLVEAKPEGNLANVLEQQTLKWIFVGGKVGALHECVLDR